MQKKKLTSGESKTAEDLSSLKLQLAEAKNNLENTLRDKKMFQEKLLKLDLESQNEKTSWETKASELESDLLVCVLHLLCHTHCLFMNFVQTRLESEI